MYALWKTLSVQRVWTTKPIKDTGSGIKYYK